MSEITGTYTNQKNPVFKKEYFKFWIPDFADYVNTKEGDLAFRLVRNICYKKIFISIFNEDWEYAMSLAIAHYLSLRSLNDQQSKGTDLKDVANGSSGDGVITSASVGNFSVSYDASLSYDNDESSQWWNKTKYGKDLINLYHAHGTITMMVIGQYPFPKPQPHKPVARVKRDKK